MVMQKKLNSKVLMTALSVAIAGSALATGGNPAAGRGGAGAGGRDATNGPKYLVEVGLSSRPLVPGSLTVFKNVNNQYVPQKTCVAIGSVRTNLMDANPANKSIKTPRGTKVVFASSDKLYYQGNFIGMTNASYFHISHGAPVAIHTGDTRGNSHGCIRVSADCSSYIRARANENSVLGSPTDVIPSDARRDVRTVSGGHMSVDVSYVN